jgi:hypothetical protein
MGEEERVEEDTYLKIVAEVLATIKADGAYNIIVQAEDDSYWVVVGRFLFVALHGSYFVDQYIHTLDGAIYDRHGSDTDMTAKRLTEKEVAQALLSS